MCTSGTEGSVPIPKDIITQRVPQLYKSISTSRRTPHVAKKNTLQGSPHGRSMYTNVMVHLFIPVVVPMLDLRTSRLYNIILTRPSRSTPVAVL